MAEQVPTAVLSAQEMCAELDRQAARRWAPELEREQLHSCVALVFTSWLEAHDGHPFFGPLVRAVRDRAIALGCDLVYCMPDEDRELDARTVDRCISRGAEGLIVFGAADGLPDVLRTRPEIAAIFVESETIGTRSGFVRVDNVGAFEDIVVHLATLGRHRIATITGLIDQRAGAERLTGYRSALERLGYPYRSEYVLIGDYSHESAYEQAKQLLALDEPPNAIAAASDVQAIGVVRALDEAGLRCPEDVAVTGFDDAPWTATVRPPLTTVRQPGPELGVAAIDALAAMVGDHSATPPRLLLPGALVVRESCGARMHV